MFREVNERVFEKAEALQDYISQTEGTIIFKLAVKIDQPDPVMTISPYIKAYFSYRPDRYILLLKPILLLFIGIHICLISILDLLSQLEMFFKFLIKQTSYIGKRRTLIIMKLV